MAKLEATLRPLLVSQGDAGRLLESVVEHIRDGYQAVEERVREGGKRVREGGRGRGGEEGREGGRGRGGGEKRGGREGGRGRGGGRRG